MSSYEEIRKLAELVNIYEARMDIENEYDKHKYAVADAFLQQLYKEMDELEEK